VKKQVGLRVQWQIFDLPQFSVKMKNEPEHSVKLRGKGLKFYLGSESNVAIKRENEHRF